MQRQIIKIDSGIQKIKKQITFIKIKQHNKFEEAISQQSLDTRVMEKILQPVKSTPNEQNQMLKFLSNTVETYDLKL